MGPSAYRGRALTIWSWIFTASHLIEDVKFEGSNPSRALTIWSWIFTTSHLIEDVNFEGSNPSRCCICKAEARKDHKHTVNVA